MPEAQRYEVGQLEVRGVGDLYQVFDGDRPVSRALSNASLAACTATKIENESRQQQRPCLSCTASFLSTGPHHRLCNDCR